MNSFGDKPPMSVPTESRPLKELEDFLRVLRATLEQQADLPSADNDGIKAILESGRKRLALADAALQQIKLAGLPVGESTTRNSEVLADFVKYCREHPYERFWQALRNWSKYHFIFAVDWAGLIRHENTYEVERRYDTFNLEGRRHDDK